MTVTPTSAYTLQPGTTYWMVLTTLTGEIAWAGGVPGITPTGIATSAGYRSGTSIQDIGHIESTLQQITFSLVATQSGGAAVFAWHSESDSASSVLVDSLLALPEGDIPAALVRFALRNWRTHSSDHHGGNNLMGPRNIGSSTELTSTRAHLMLPIPIVCATMGAEQ